jgi:hypothetical protein
MPVLLYLRVWIAVLGEYLLHTLCVGDILCWLALLFVYRHRIVVVVGGTFSNGSMAPDDPGTVY